MLAFLDSPCLIKVVNGVQTLNENHTGIFKLSGSCWLIRCCLEEDAAAVKIAAEMNVYRVKPQQIPISQNLGYIISK